LFCGDTAECNVGVMGRTDILGILPSPCELRSLANRCSGGVEEIWR